MSDYIVEQLSILGGKGLEYLQSLVKRLKQADRATKKNIYLGTSTLMLGIGLFFSSYFGGPAYAKNSVYKDKISPEVAASINRTGRYALGKYQAPRAELCAVRTKTSGTGPKEAAFQRLVNGYPIARMVPFIVRRNSRVAAYLVAIAKKESDWGKHTPKKNGKECYNYWGYKGGYNPTEGGYSCFDSPEQAVTVVGNRIEKLINQKLDTPARMVVWKCGGSCEATGGQAAADRWISDVAYYFKKLAS